MSFNWEAVGTLWLIASVVALNIALLVLGVEKAHCRFGPNGPLAVVVLWLFLVVTLVVGFATS